MKRLIIFSMVLLTMLSCSRPNKQRLVLQGSTTLLPIIQQISEIFHQKYPDVKISVRGGGSGNGIATLIDGITDIAMASRPMKQEEIELCQKRGYTAVEHKIAVDGIAIIVNKSNPITNLSMSDLQKIYAGEYKDWSELGSFSKKIVVVSRDSASGTYEEFKKIVMQGKEIKKDALTQTSNNSILSIVANTPGAIGYVGLGYVNDTIKLVSIDGIVPTKETILLGDYEITRPLFLYTVKERENSIVLDFINFVLSASGQKIVADKGYIPVK